MNFGYNGYSNPYARNYGTPNYIPQQYTQQPQQIMPQQMAQPQQQPMQYETPIQYVGYANLKEAEGHILFPNQKALFIDKANGMVYEKVCGQDGQSFISHFKKVEENTENQAVGTPKEQPTIDLSSYAKKDDLGNFASLKQVEELNSKFEELKKMLGAKQNVLQKPTT